MGQQTCCESIGNKKHSNNKEDQNYGIDEKSNDYKSSSLNRNSYKLKIDQNESPKYNPFVKPNINGSNVNQDIYNSTNLTNASVQSTNNNFTLPKTNLNYNSTSNFSCIKSFEAHDNKVVCLIELYNGLIASGAYDGTIKIWDINTQQCIKIINVSENVLCLLEFVPGTILCGTDGSIITVWDINSTQNLGSFEGHLLWINCLVKCDYYNFASGSNDSDIRIWNYQERECVNILKGHDDCVLTMIRLKNGNLCSGSADSTIKIWDWESGTCLNTLMGHRKWVKCVFQLSNGYIISGSDDKTIKIWSNYNNIGQLTGHIRPIRSFCQISNNLFASASFDKTIKIWDFNKMNLVQTLEGHKANVICVIFHSLGYLISCSTDQTIKIWKK